ncbi:hypothetical protein FRC01_001224 [Tulasnella sp. 417]|nr:hypothetical protein FRC01_001224 [Tulasnella sp. 417]
MANNKGPGSKSDRPFTEDWGFWAIQSEFDAYQAAIKGLKVKETDIPKCHNFKAGDPSRSGGGTGTVVGGSVIVSCSRHIFIQPNGVTDLQKAEKFVEVDPAVASVVRAQHPGQRQVHSYDVACKYGINFKKRTTMDFDGGPLIKPEQFPKDIQFLVPAWHILGHVEECLARYHFRYTPLVGRTAGEGVETIWSSLNGWQYSTREMGHGHRRDTLTDVMNHFNWTKTRKEARRLYSACFDAMSEYERKEEALKEIEEDLPLDYLSKLKSESASRGPEQFLSATIQVPTKTQILRAIRDAEDAEEKVTRLSSDHSEAMFINNAIDLADFQLQEADLMRGQPPTAQTLYLPSNFITDDHSKYKLEKIADKEAQLQVAEAHDALRRLRNALGLKALLLQNQKKHVQGYEEASRAKTSVLNAEKGIRRQVAAYKRAWKAIGLLGVEVGSDTPAGDLRALLDTDVVPLREFSDDRRYAGDSEGIPWIWKIVSVNQADREAEQGVLGTVNSWNNEGEYLRVAAGLGEKLCLYNIVVRLAWLHAQATRDCWWEETMLLKEELRRVGASFSAKEKAWSSIAEASNVEKEKETRLTRGVKAYASRQAAVYNYLALDAHQRYEKAITPYSQSPFHRTSKAQRNEGNDYVGLGT